MAEIAPRNGAESHAEIPWPPPPSNPAPPPVLVCSGLMAAEAGAGNAEAGVPPAAEKSDRVVVDVECGGEGADDDGSDREGEMVCRICHLILGGGEEGSELMQLGCGCKGELGVAHRHCAEAWFRVKGNRCCEICGANAKNITVEEDSRFAVEGHDGSESNSRNSSETSGRVGCWRRQPFCNFLMACLMIAFILLWFFRVSMF